MLKRTIACLLLLTCSYASPAGAQTPVRYVYDDLGRLIGVIDQNGDAATYNYDAVGNLLSIGRTAASTVSVIAFAPASGSIGTTVTITGTAFSATPASNSVTFNGTAAVVSTASANELVVTVPSGATTGTISVTSPLGSATSTGTFTVTSGSLAPTITSFTPTSGLAGASVTVNGTNFDTVLPNDRTRFNATFAAPSGATSTTISTPVPANTGSGHISVATPYGTAVSTDDFIIPPPGYAVADVQVSGRIPFATATTATISTVDKIGLMLFDSSPGHRVSLNGTNGASGHIFGCDIFVSILNPNTTSYAAPTCMESAGFIDATATPVTGTYTIVIDPADTVTGAVTLTLYDVPPDEGGTITPGGSAVTVTTSTPGQNGALTFSGTAGQRVSVQGTNGMTGQIAFACDVFVSILKPDSSTLAAATCMEGSGFIDAITLPTTGTYTVKVDPAAVAVGSLTLALYSVPSDVTGTITAGGSSVTVTTTTPGQNGVLTFSGTAGQRVSVQGTNGMTGQIAFACDVFVSILKPDSSTLAAATCMEGSGFIDAITLPTTGTYTIKVDPAAVAVGSLTLALYSVPSDVTGTITAGGSSVTVTTTTPGQNGALTFSGTAGQRVSVQGTNGMTGQVAFACDVFVSILKPDSSTLAAATCMEGSGFIDAITLPTTGTYTIKVDPAAVAVGSVTLALYSVPADATGSVTIGGSSLTLTTTTPGQNANATFAGTSSQQVTVHLTSNSMGSVIVKLLKPDGTQLALTTSSAASFNLATQTLPTTGTYTIVVDPGGAASGSITVNVTNP